MKMSERMPRKLVYVVTWRRNPFHRLGRSPGDAIEGVCAVFTTARAAAGHAVSRMRISPQNDYSVVPVPFNTPPVRRMRSLLQRLARLRGISGADDLGFEIVNKGRCGYPDCKRSAVLFCDKHAKEIRGAANRPAQQKRKR